MARLLGFGVKVLWHALQRQRADPLRLVPKRLQRALLQWEQVRVITTTTYNRNAPKSNAQPSIDQAQVRELQTLRFVHEASNVLFLGPPGVGKTHLAVALAVEAIRAGFSAQFITAHDLVSDLGKAAREGRLDRRLRSLVTPKVLIVDEVGYLPLDEVGATLFFQLVSTRYERGSILLTSNKSYGDWGSVLGDAVIATAVLDRLLHHSTTVNIRGDSYRLKERKKAGLLAPLERKEAMAAPS